MGRGNFRDDGQAQPGARRCAPTLLPAMESPKDALALGFWNARAPVQDADPGGLLDLNQHRAASGGMGDGILEKVLQSDGESGAIGAHRGWSGRIDKFEVNATL